MKPSEKSDIYPVFEPNQVLSSSHLNQVFDYLDEQERLTRANLIGIGIVCGLDIRLDATAAATVIRLSKGCGVTSEGYLIVEPHDVELVAYREYQLPGDPDYTPFTDTSSEESKKYHLWELFLAGEPETTPLASPADFLSDKTMLLFLELDKGQLRNCSPNNCDDKGSAVTVTLRRLLIRTIDLEAIVNNAKKLASGMTSIETADALVAKLDLKDIRLPRYDVPKSNLVTTEQVLAAFLAVFQGLPSKTGDALTEAYKAFNPLLKDMYPENPFTGFAEKFGFLDSAPETAEQVLSLQYYFDFFDDLIKAYDEFRWKGIDLISACCPDERLFPRHLMLGVLVPEAGTDPAIFRQQFLRSPALSSCGERLKELKQLFQRLEGMINSFTNTPLPPSSADPVKDPQIRITPSKAGDVPLSDKAIPYYYLQNGDPRLYQLWNFDKTSLNRAGQNLSYRADEYEPAPPPFVTDPLSYDLEPFNFLRIEGHLGRDYRAVLKSLLSLKSKYRLPIEVIGLRAGAFEESAGVDLGKEACRFQDLEAIYDTLREDLLSNLCEGVRYLYNIPIPKSNLAGGTPQLSLLKKYAPNYIYKSDTVGAWYEYNLGKIQSIPYVDLDQDDIALRESQLQNFFHYLTAQGLPAAHSATGVSTYYLVMFAEVLLDSLTSLSFADVEKRYLDLKAVILYFRWKVEEERKKSENLSQFIPWEDLMDHLNQVLFSCKIEPVKALFEKHSRRLREIKQKQYLNFFLKKHPGIQHKAGVPLGGTFIIVYHDTSDPIKGVTGLKVKEAFAGSNVVVGSGSKTEVLSETLKRIKLRAEMLADPDIQAIFWELTGQIPRKPFSPGLGGLSKETQKIFMDTVNGLRDGTVIADFFLPYLCCSDCPPIQYVLPPPPLGLSVQLGCTSSEGAVATLTPQGGTAPFSYRLDDKPVKVQDGVLMLPPGSHTLSIRDSAGAESEPQTITVIPPITFGTPTFHCSDDSSSYTATIPILGGTPPYTVNGTKINKNTYITKPIASGTAALIKVVDSNQCPAKTEISYTCIKPCELPCDGIARRCGYRFWLPAPVHNQKNGYTKYQADVPVFKLVFPETDKTLDLANEVTGILNKPKPSDLNKDFDNVVQAWLKEINDLILKATGNQEWLRLKFVKSKTDPMGTLLMEYWECLRFEFRIKSMFEQLEKPETLDVIYTPQKTQIRNLKVTVPAFDCVEIDKCHPEHSPVRPCEEVNLTLKITPELDAKNKLTLDVQPSGTDKPTAYLWEVQDGIPPLSNNAKADFTFYPLQPLTKMIRLTAYTKDGCRVIASDTIVLKGPVVPKSPRKKRVIKKIPKKPR